MSYLSLIQVEEVIIGISKMLPLLKWFFVAGGFELATSTAQNRKRFTASILEVITSHGFDGVDIDWVIDLSV